MYRIEKLRLIRLRLEEGCQFTNNVNGLIVNNEMIVPEEESNASALCRLFARLLRTEEEILE